MGRVCTTFRAWMRAVRAVRAVLHVVTRAQRLRQISTGQTRIIHLDYALKDRLDAWCDGLFVPFARFG